jgi:hypothetical protein
MCVDQDARVLTQDTATFRVFTKKPGAQAIVTLTASVEVSTLAKLKKGASRVGELQKWPDFSFKGHAQDDPNAPLCDLGYLNNTAYRLFALRSTGAPTVPVAQEPADAGAFSDAVELSCQFNNGTERTVRLDSSAGAVYDYVMDQLQEYLLYDTEYYVVLLDGEHLDKRKNREELGLEVGKKYYIDLMVHQVGGK